MIKTGEITVMADMKYKRVGGMVDGSTIDFTVEIWTGEIFGDDKRRGHIMTLSIPAPMTDWAYECAYKEILGTYEGYWEQLNALPPGHWKHDLAVACGQAMTRFMKAEAFVSRQLCHA